tara:strand:- start:283 stop:603 length:321 start_codon:yes stop_codon:yes gene_type:complete
MLKGKSKYATDYRWKNVNHKKYEEEDNIDFNLPLRERLKINKKCGVTIKDIHQNYSEHINNPDLDDLMYAVSIFRQVNKINFVHPSHVFFIMRRLGWVKGDNYGVS